MKLNSGLQLVWTGFSPGPLFFSYWQSISRRMALRRAITSLAQRLVGFEAEGVASMLGGSRIMETVSADAQRHASNQAVKLRIRAIKNIGKITKAMKASLHIITIIRSSTLAIRCMDSPTNIIDHTDGCRIKDEERTKSSRELERHRRSFLSPLW